jgi:hypothetical protein
MIFGTIAGILERSATRTRRRSAGTHSLSQEICKLTLRGHAAVFRGDRRISATKRCAASLELRT